MEVKVGPSDRLFLALSLNDRLDRFIGDSRYQKYVREHDYAIDICLIRYIRFGSVEVRATPRRNERSAHRLWNVEDRGIEVAGAISMTRRNELLPGKDH